MADDSVALGMLDDYISLLHRFAMFDPNMQLSTVMTFIEIAKADLKGELISTADIERRVGLKSGTASRNIYYWAEGHKDMRGGHHMVDVRVDKQDMRRRILKLTQKGRFFLGSLTEQAA